MAAVPCARAPLSPQGSRETEESGQRAELQPIEHRQRAGLREALLLSSSDGVPWPPPMPLASPLRTIVAPLLLAFACSTASGPQPQRATFPPGERVARVGTVTLELAEAHYDLRQVSLTVTVTNRGEAPLRLERDGILLAYNQLEYPVLPSEAKPVPESTELPPGAAVQLELDFGTEQLMVQAATLRVLSIHASESDWLAPLQLTVPPPAAFVEAAAQPEEEF